MPKKKQKLPPCEIFVQGVRVEPAGIDQLKRACIRVPRDVVDKLRPEVRGRIAHSRLKIGEGRDQHVDVRVEVWKSSPDFFAHFGVSDPDRQAGGAVVYVNDALIGGESFRSLQRAFTNKQMDPRNEQGKVVIIRLHASSPAVLREILTTSKIKLKDGMQAR